jgi:hypothetical protein
MTSGKKLFSTNGGTMLNARKAASLLGCAPDYVSRLCREGKLEGVRHQGQWYIDPKSLARFEAEREAARIERAQMLATERRSESLARIVFSPAHTRMRRVGLDKFLKFISERQISRNRAAE